jgi:hypothetical protein
MGAGYTTPDLEKGLMGKEYDHNLCITVIAAKGSEQLSIVTNMWRESTGVY